MWKDKVLRGKKNKTYKRWACEKNGFMASILRTDFEIERALTSPPGVKIWVIPLEADEFQTKTLMITLA